MASHAMRAKPAMLHYPRYAALPPLCCITPAVLCCAALLLQASRQWQELLGLPQCGSEDASLHPASTQPVVGLLSLEAQAQQGLRRLASLGHLSAADLALALQLAQNMHQWYPATPRRKVGVPVACMLQVVTLARGGAMSHTAAAAAVQEVGMEATAKAIGNRLRVLLKHWQASAGGEECVWCGVVGVGRWVGGCGGEGELGSPIRTGLARRGE